MSRVGVSRSAFIEETIMSRFSNSQLVDSIHCSKYLRLVGKNTIDVGVVGRNDALGYIPLLWNYVQGEITFDSFIEQTCQRLVPVSEDEQFANALWVLNNLDCDVIFIKTEDKVTCLVVSFNPETQGVDSVDLCPLPAESCVFGVGSMTFSEKLTGPDDLNYVSPVFKAKTAGDYTGLAVEVNCLKSNVSFSQCLCVSAFQPYKLMMI